MLLAYLDESGDQKTYTMTSLLVEEVDAIALASSLDEVVKLAPYELIDNWPNTELHAYDLAWGLNDWRALRGDVDTCATIYASAIDAIAKYNVRICSRGVDLVGLNKRYSGGADPHSVTLAFALERIDAQAAHSSTVALVIADEVGKKQPAYRKNFKEYQQTGTWGWKGKVLAHLVDTIHFAPSVSSRLIQAADMVSYTRFEVNRLNGTPRAREFYIEQWKKLMPRVVENSCWYPSGK